MTLWWFLTGVAVGVVIGAGLFCVGLLVGDMWATVYIEKYLRVR